MSSKKKIKNALEIASKYGGNDGSHHKMWVIDQMVRALTGCPVVKKQGIDYEGDPFNFEEMGKNKKYLKWVDIHQQGEDGPLTYEWDTGIAP